jgi:hypothetical protein
MWGQLGETSGAVGNLLTVWVFVRRVKRIAAITSGLGDHGGVHSTVLAVGAGGELMAVRALWGKHEGEVSKW